MHTSPETKATEPAQSLRLPPERMGLAAMFWVLFGVVALGGLLAASAIYTAPVVLSDWQVRETAQPVPAARVSDGKCSAKLVLHICDASLTLRTPQGSVTRRVNYVFTGLHAGDYSVGAMADPARPDLVTTNLGLERLWNRTITLVVLMGALAACIYGALLGLIRNRRATA
jgi:hypothetical protein